MQPDDKIKDRIRKLLALGSDRNPNEHERQEALSAGRELLDRHGLTVAELGTEKGKVEVWGCNLPTDTWCLLVIQSVCKLYDTDYIIVPIAGHRDYVALIGVYEYIQVTNEITNWIIQGILKEAAERYSPVDALNLSGFYAGVSYRIAERVEEIMSARKLDLGPDNGKNQLMVITDALRKEIDATLEALEVRQQNKLLLPGTDEATTAGFEYGDTVSLERQLSGESTKCLTTCNKP